MAKALRKIRYGLLLVRKGGLSTFARHLGLQLCSRTSFLGLEKDLHTGPVTVGRQVDYRLRLATPQDMEQMMGLLGGEGGEAVYELLGRRWFYDRGFRSSYVAVTDSDDICHLAWLLSPADNDLIRHHCRSRLPELAEGEAMLENSFTFPEFRGKGLMTAVALDLSEMARSQGFRRMVAYVNKENGPSLRSLDRAGFRPFGEVREVKLLFTTRRGSLSPLKAPGGAALGPGTVRAPNTTGALVIGGTFQSLGILRSLARHAIPVYLAESGLSISQFSRCKKRFFRCPRVTQEAEFLQFLKELALREGLQGWVIYPNDDETVHFLAQHKEELEAYYRVPVPSYEVVRLAYEKRLTYLLAESAGIPIPQTFYPGDVEELERLELEFPVIIKPSIRANFYHKTRKKAIRVDSRGQLKQEYLKAVAIIDSSEVMVQELIPGGPHNLYSFGSLYKGGQVLGRVMARRARQHPMDFGHATTYAETVSIPELEELATRLLGAMGYYGISEVEFMQDPRDGKYKLIEVNARPWGWHSLAIAAGADLPYLLYLDMLGEKAEANGFVENMKWFRLSTDIPTVAGELLRGRMGLRDYLRSWRGKRTFAVFSVRDPLPFLAELALLPYLWKKRGF